jgi:D-alanyl-D-alanine carboxypeptidase
MRTKTVKLTLIAALALAGVHLAHAQAPAPAPSAHVGLQGARTLVGLASYPRRNIKLAYTSGPVNGQSGEAVSIDTPFRIASITKSFTAAAIFKLIEQNKFTLDSSIKGLLSPATVAQLESAQLDLNAITIARLLGHRSGLPEYATDGTYISAVLANPTRRWRRSEQLAIALEDLSPEAPPAPAGSSYLYADTNYIVLGEIIERTTDKTLAASLRGLLNFAALGLTQTYLESVEAPPAGQRSRLHTFVQGFDTFQIDASFDLYGGGGLVSTAGDLTRFYRALFAGRVVSTASLQAMTRAVSGGGFSEFAYSLGLMPFFVGNTECFGHEGFGSVVAGHCPSIDYTFAYAAGSDAIPDIKLTERGIGTRVADYIAIDTTPRPYGADFERTRCPPELLSPGAAVSCGVMAVEQSRGQPSSRQLRVPVVIAKHRTRAANLQPLLLLGGGPGDALFPTLPALLGDATLSAALVDGQDVIAAEYRGTGSAKPNLQCDARLTNAATVNLCLEKMARLGVQLNRYNGIEFGHDIEQLRRSLRVSQWNLAGFSYGTRAALSILRERPSTVRSVVLDGVTTPDESFGRPNTAVLALDAYFQSCQSDARCNSAFGTLKTRFVARMTQLNQMPLLINGAAVNGDTLVQALTLFQASPDLLGYMPAIMDRFANADAQFLAAILSAPTPGELLPPDPGFSDALFFSTICNESAPFVNLAQYRSDANGADPILRAYTRQALATLNLCPLWPSGRAADRENRDVPLSVPSMLLVSRFDLQTPAVNGQALAARNPRTASVYEFPTGHVALQQAPECALQLLINFQRKRTAAPIDSSCVATQAPVQWQTKIDDAFFALIGRG